MGLTYLWDTNTCIYFLGRLFSPPAERFIDEILKNSRPCISVVTEIELLCWTSVNQSEQILLREFVGDFFVFELDQQVKRETIRIRRDFKVKLPDAIIAGTSLLNDFTLLTRNVKDFDRIDSLRWINPWDL